MKYLCLVYLSEENWSACPDTTCFAFAEQLAQSGHMLAAEPLHPIQTATTVRVRNGQMSMTDGPFAENIGIIWIANHKACRRHDTADCYWNSTAVIVNRGRIIDGYDGNRNDYINWIIGNATCADIAAKA